MHKIGAGALSGTVGSAIANPTDLIKVRMQADIHGSRYSGLLHAFRSIYREEGGLSGLYKVGPSAFLVVLAVKATETSQWIQRIPLTVQAGP